MPLSCFLSLRNRSSDKTLASLEAVELTAEIGLPRTNESVSLDRILQMGQRSDLEKEPACNRNPKRASPEPVRPLVTYC
jgi:hypothetical protein